MIPRVTKNVENNESVATLLWIGSDLLSVLPYFTGPKLTKEGEDVRTGRIRGGSD